MISSTIPPSSDLWCKWISRERRGFGILGPPWPANPAAVLWSQAGKPQWCAIWPSFRQRWKEAGCCCHHRPVPDLQTPHVASQVSEFMLNICIIRDVTSLEWHDSTEFILLLSLFRMTEKEDPATGEVVQRLCHPVELFQKVYSTTHLQRTYRGKVELQLFIIVHKIFVVMKFIYRQLRMRTDPNFVLVSEMLLLHSICLCIMVGNAEAERVFSTMNRIKTNLRNLLGHEQLERLIRVSHSKVRVEDFALGTAVDIFLAARDRRLWINH